MMNYRLLRCSMFILAYLAVFCVPAVDAAHRRALLVGCSEYADPDIPKLVGAVNDASSLGDLLREKFGFDDITTLVGWPGDEKKRPTYANICAAFEHLIATAAPGDQIVISMSGHGFRFPLPENQTDVFDSANPEPDGLDESFLPADYESGRNMILDNQFGQWLDQLKAKRTHVWIIFDCCFSGTMTRGGAAADRAEPIRELSPDQAGIPLSSIKKSIDRAVLQRSDKPAFKANASDGLDLRINPEKVGSVVAFYAAQDFQKAPEVVRPRDADPEDPKNKHGLLSYHIHNLLRDRKENTSYADLGRSLVTQYQADGRREPFPSWDGDVDQEVLGLKKWPESRPIVCERSMGELRLTGGKLAGLRVDTVVAVFAPQDKDFTAPLGYLRVTSASPTAASVEPFQASGESITTVVSSIPDNAICRIVSQPVSDSRINLWVQKIDGTEQAQPLTTVVDAIRSAASPQAAVFQIANSQQEADWVFATVTPELAKNRLGIVETETVGILLPSADAVRLFEKPDSPPNETPTLARTPHAIIPRQLLNEPDKLADHLSLELQKIYTWQAVWRLAGDYSETSPYVGKRTIGLEVRKTSDINDKSDGAALTHGQLQAGDSVVLRVTNSGYEPYWYVVLFLNGRFGIVDRDKHQTWSGSIQGRAFQNTAQTQTAREILRFNVNEQSVGTNGFVVIAVNQKEHPQRPDYRFLTQGALNATGTRSSADLNSLTTPFEKLLLGTLSSRQRMRGSQSPDNPQIASWSWITVPSEVKKNK